MRSVLSLCARSLAIALLTLATLACDGGVDADVQGWTFADVPEPTVVTDTASGTLRFDEVSRYGTLEGLGAIGRIAAVAANERYVVVADDYGCDLVIFSRASREAERRIGSCGEGPGEFREFRSLQLVGDSLLVVDGEGNRIRLLTLDGAELRRLRLDVMQIGSRHGASYAYVTDDGNMVIGANVGLSPLRGDGGASLTTPFIHLVRNGESQASTDFLYDSPEAMRRAIAVRTARGCLMPSTGQGPSTLVAMNYWVPQIVALSVQADVRPSHSLLWPVIPQRPVAGKREPELRNKWVGLTEAACGDSVALLSWRTWSDSAAAYDRNGPPPDVAYLMAFWPRTGRYATTYIKDEPAVVLGRLAAAEGSSFFYAHTMRTEFPVVIETRLQAIE